MAQSGYTPIITYYSNTTGNTPTSISLGELAVNVIDSKLFIGTGTNTFKTLVNPAGTTSITTLGTVTTGTWNATIITGTYGGTGVNNGANTITIAGNVTHAGAFTQTFTATGNTSVTLPTSGYVVSSVTQLGANPVTGTTSSTTFLRGDGTWASAGTNITLTNDTTTATNVYPVFASATSGTVTGLYTGNANLLYKPSTGDLTASQHIASNGLMVNNQTIGTSYSIPTGYSAMSTGPITLSSGVSVTLGASSKWAIL